MSGHVYLIKKGDFFMIGSTRNIDKQMRKLRPDEIISTTEIDSPEGLEARLLRRYRKVRLPESGYFQLSERQLIDCKKQLGEKSKIPKTIGAEFSIAITGTLFLFLLSSFVFLRISLSPILELSLAFALASLPMWLLFVLGNFGGYFSSDLSLFSSWFNRIRALLLALILSLCSYLLISKISF